VSSTFVEPSDAGGFLSCWLLFELILANQGSTKRTRHWIFAIVGCVVLLATTSTTGYATVAFILAAMGARLAYEAIRRGRILIRTGLALCAVVVVGIAFLVGGHGVSLLDAVLFNKGGSSSAVHRMGTVWRALAVMRDTYGLGAGLGSNRAFGTLAYICSNLGVFGLAVFLFMIGHLSQNTFSYLKASPGSSATKVALIACSAALAADLLSLVISGAEISNPRIWVVWGILIASLRAQIHAADSEPYETVSQASADALYAKSA